ncbi:hypothetical protein ACFU96_43255 [Streptomyces sp. NPDC057620]|uniref:hypothetical protein n=1 Tax=Streptomyces sp. NPDC057620 TaxID=3346185 RepID=UPI00368654C7
MVTFQREISSTDDPEQKGIQLHLDCWETTADVRASVLAGFLQRWKLREVLIGDHVATLSLAPGEVQTVETRRTGRTLLEESRETASTVEVAGELTETDKDAIHVANTSAQSSNWSVSGTGGFSLSGIGASASATQAGTITSSLATTGDHIHETTLRSSQKVATQSKLQVRGVSETAVETRQTRILRNPFLDRVLHFNMYEINKQFEVHTQQSSTWPMLTAHLHPLDFTRQVAVQEFIASNVPFLQEALLDEELRKALPGVVGAIRQDTLDTAQRADNERLLTNALDNIERYLFENRSGWQPYHHANDVEDIIADRAASIGAMVQADGDSAAVDAASQGAESLQLYLLLHSAWTVREWALPKPNQDFDNQRYAFFTTLGAAVKDLWLSKLNEGNRKALLDQGSKTELFRRIPGFLCMVQQLELMKQPEASEESMRSLISALVEHLRCHHRYYSEQYFRHLWTRLGRTFVLHLANSLLYGVYEGTEAPHDIDSCRPYRNLFRAEDVQRDGLCVLIPLQPAAAQGLGTGTGPGAAPLARAITDLVTELAKVKPPPPRVGDLVVPADGLHLEAVAGQCLLPLPKDCEDCGTETGRDKGNGGSERAEA